jgi:phosphoribosylaminoimidazole carboxylase (NCAIR synthetase)
LTAEQAGFFLLSQSGERPERYADLKRITPQVVAVQLDQVESVQKLAAVSAVVTNEIERGNAVVIAGDSFAIDDAGARA